MISLRIKDTKTFMSQLFIKDTFDNFLLSEADIKTACSYRIDGQVNRTFYTDEEWSSLNEDSTKYTAWHSLKPFCFSIIKGNKVPSLLRIVMLLPGSEAARLLSHIETDISPDNINGLFINIRYQDGRADIITGTSLNIFSLDKALDSAFDSYIKSFLSDNGIDFEDALY